MIAIMYTREVSYAHTGVKMTYKKHKGVIIVRDNESEKWCP